MIVPYAPGGGSDATARLVAQKLSESLGQTVVVDNRTGAGGILGMEMAAKAAPDGYTLVLGATGTLSINPSLYRSLPYDALRDFTPISLVIVTPCVLVANPALPIHSVAELIAYAKANPGKLNYSSSGVGGSSHLAGALFNAMAGTQMAHIPYRGTGPAALAVVAGEVSVTFADVYATLPHVKSGRVRALAVTSITRMQAMPELPTIAEAGVPGYEAGSWFGVLGPAGMPHDVVVRLASELADIVNAPQMREKLISDGSIPVGNTPEEFARHIRAENARWSRVIKQENIHAD
ncbi:tripartite tricarboxylate transporter substrate binding protein [Pigmentiphaga soli]|uniref:Tripartite tricarboxylate transporter substrate binding protein n=2 Tax=Pigmentiphaga soli TaxID=1007095 RepID=A0ABP8H995_9BURK